MGRAALIGNGKQHLIPTFQPLVDGGYQSARRKNSTQGTGVAARAVVSQQGKAYALNKAGGKNAGPGKVLAESREPAGDVRFRSSQPDRKSTRLNSSHSQISYAVFCLKKKKQSQSSHLPRRS